MRLQRITLLHRRRAVGLGVVAVLAALGCGVSAASGSTAAKASAPKVQLRMALISNGVTPGVTDAIASFEKAYPKIKIDLTSLGEGQYLSTVRTQLAAGTGPDIFYTPSGSGNPMAIDDIAKAGLAVNLDNQPWAKNVDSMARAVSGPNGKIYVWPDGLTGITAIYNPAIFSGYGLTVPTTWSGVLSYCQAATAKGLVGFAYGAQDQTTAMMYALALVASTVYGPHPNYNATVEDGKANLTKSAGWASALNKVLAMQKAGCFNPSPAGTTFPAAIGTFLSAKAGAMVWINAIAGSFEAESKGQLKLASFPLPASDNPAANYTAVFPGGGFAINAHSSHQQQAEEFLSYLARRTVAAKLFKESDEVSAFTNVTVKPSANQAPVLAALEHGKAGGLPFWNNDQTQNAMIAGIQSLLAGQGTVADVLAQMQATIPVR